MAKTTTERVAKRFGSKPMGKYETQLSDKLGELDEEMKDLKELNDRLEEIIFMEEDAAKLNDDFRKFAVKHPDLAKAYSHVSRAMDMLVGRVIPAVSNACEEIDDAIARRDGETVDIEDQLKGE